MREVKRKTVRKVGQIESICKKEGRKEGKAYKELDREGKTNKLRESHKSFNNAKKKKFHFDMISMTHAQY